MTFMRISRIALSAACLIVVSTIATAQQPAGSPAAADTTINDAVKTMVSRLDLERYKATIKGLTQFGDRRQGTDRNRAAVDWIEAQLKASGCINTERIKYVYDPPPPAGRGRGNTGRGADAAQGGGR